MKRVCFIGFTIFLVFGLAGCLSQSDVASSEGDTGVKQSRQATQQKPQMETADEQMANVQEQFMKDWQPLVDRQKANGENWKAGVADLEEVLKPKTVSGTEALKFLSSAEVGMPFYFKIRAIYKGFDKENGKVHLEDIDPTVSEHDALLSMAFGVDTAVYTLDQKDEPTKVKEPNTLATFYCFGFRLAESGESASSLTPILIDENSVVELFDKTKFTVVSGMSYISVYDASTPTQEDVMMSFFSGGAMGNESASIFDPIKYKPSDLMDARVAMDKKDIRNDYTFPTVKVKYVSEVLFKGQSGTTITVSTDDNVLTERLNFTGRASAITAGEKVKVYYTIAKDPLEKWELQAIERL